MICPHFSDPIFFLFSSDPKVSPLLYYSHIPTAIVALLVGFFVFLKNRGFLAARLLFFISIAFLFWVLCDLVTWTSNDSDVIAFSWSFFGIFYTLLSLLSVYFVYAFVDGKDVSFFVKLFLSALFLPVVLFTPTEFNVDVFYLDACGISDGALFFTHYYYFVGFVSFVWILGIIISRLRQKDILLDMKKQILLLGFGTEFFLFSLFVSGFLASFLVDYGIVQDFGLEQYGLFSMPIFLGFLAYLIVQYQAFNIKLIATQALVIGLSMLIGSQLFFIKSLTNFVLTSITFFISIFFGIMLIRSVKEEIERKEELQNMADKLTLANDELHRLDQSKSEFISIASHQLRTPLTAIKGFVSLILEGSYGEISGNVENVLNKIYISNERIINLVENLLDISRMEYGRIQYQYAEVNISDILNELRDTFVIAAKNKGISINFEIPENPLPLVWIDRQKSFEIISNLIDNSIKYTPQGSVLVRAEAVPDAVRVSVKDTGIGISKETMQCLFVKFSRGKDVSKVYTNGVGLGLYVGKNMTEAQGGRLWAESEGKDKGATFFVEFPVKK